MRRTILLLALAVVAGGCHWGGLGGGKAGSGKMKLEKRPVGAFKAVHLSGAYEVEIVAQKEQALEIEGDDNLLEFIKTEVNDGVLDISSNKSFSTRNPIRVRISVQQLDSISTSGASDVIVSNVKSDAFNIETSGASNIKISGEAKALDLGMSGAGEVDARELRAKMVSVNSSGAAEAHVYASDELRVSASGAGSVNYYGDPKNVSEDVSGAASISKK